MIKILDKYNCCGCEACRTICPVECINMSEDNEGFLYPHVDDALCLNCHLCEKVCPILNPKQDRTPVEVIAAQNLNEKERLKSSSGGVFSLMAADVIRQGGVVFGAAFNEQWEVEHQYVEQIEDIIRFQGSKYVQSRIGRAYEYAEEFLKHGILVLFSGTPCQIAGLKRYLRKDYDNLITVDFICHGVPSPGIFRSYLYEEIENFACKGEGKNTVSLRSIHSISERNALLRKQHITIESIAFRNKEKGWKKYSFALTLSKTSAAGEKNTVLLSQTLDKNLYLGGFIQNLYLRPSCYHCKFRMGCSGSDYKMADLWHIELAPQFNDDKGTSMIIAFRSKLNLQNYIWNSKNLPLSMFYNSSYFFSPRERKRKRKAFYKAYNRNKNPLFELMARYIPFSFDELVVNKLFQIIRNNRKR